jgi:hypothetical protein
MRRLALFTMLTTLSAIAGCDPGVHVDADDDAPDASTIQQFDAATGPQIDAATAAACEQPNPTIPDGKHNAGQACLNCHSASGGAPPFTIGGTLYATKTGVGAIQGATIIVTDANGVDIKLTSGTLGNFYSTVPMAYPIKVKASLCPDTVPMFASVTSPGDCNAGGCHALNAPSGRVHLP